MLKSKATPSKYFLVFFGLIVILTYFMPMNRTHRVYNDHTMRWQESRYMWHGINAYDIASGLLPPIEGIGALRHDMGYPPWAMVSGILMNFTFLPAETSSQVMQALIFAGLLTAIGLAYIHGKAKGYANVDIVLLAVSILMLQGWYTVWRWLNFGALFGILLCILVILNEEEEHPVIAGLLLSWVFSKPQMAAPFIIVMMFRGKWKTLFVAGAVVVIQFAFACIHTGTSPIRFLGQIGTGLIGRSFIRDTLQILGVSNTVHLSRTLSMLIAMGILVFITINLPKKCDKWVVYAAPAVISQIWTYNQPHDSTIYIIFLFAIFDFLKRQSDGQPTPISWRMIAWAGLISVTVRSNHLGRIFAGIFDIGAGGVNHFIFVSYPYIQILTLIMLLMDCYTYMPDSSDSDITQPLKRNRLKKLLNEV